MSDGIKVQVDDTQVLAKFDVMPGRVHDALVAKVGALDLQLEAKVKNKLSGAVLQVKTGALRRSIFSTVEDQGNAVYGVVASSGDVKYAAIHEFGFSGTEAVKAHVRQISQAFGKPLKNAIAVQVRAFDRKMDMPQRSFLRSSLAEMKDAITQGLQQAVREAVNQ